MFGAFSHLLDDNPLPLDEVSASELMVSFSHGHPQSSQAPMVGLRPSMAEVDRGFVTLVASDHPGIEVCNPNGHWYPADVGSSPDVLLLLTGRALSHVTAGLRLNSQYRIINNENRASLMFRLMPRANAILDCSPISAAGHCTPQIHRPISASQFMDDLRAEENVYHHLEAPPESQGNFVNEPSLRSVLSDPLSGAFLEDAMVLPCGHSFGGLMLKKVLELARCSICNGDVDEASLFPNLALRAVATVVKMEDDRRLFHNAALRKRRKEVTEHMDAQRRNGSSKDSIELGLEAESPRAFKGVQYPFVVGERVLIMVHGKCTVTIKKGRGGNGEQFSERWTLFSARAGKQKDA
uniref:RING/U-box superfamily protein n=1 Tax=Zea mays TaxID=4577 RepID=A0A804PRY4_MAIZE